MWTRPVPPLVVHIHTYRHTYSHTMWTRAVPPLVVHILTFALRDPRINGSLYKLVDFVMKQVYIYVYIHKCIHIYT